MRWLTLCSYTIALLLQGSLVAWAHPGPLDACAGHIAEERVEYPAHPDLQPTFPSEPGEYHFQFTTQEAEEAQRTLYAYRTTHPLQTADGPDYGSFTVGSMWYDVLNYTRPDANGERVAIVRCRSEHDPLTTGIVRIK